MRTVWVVLLFMLMPGCLNEEAEKDQPDLFGACPQWVPGPAVVTVETAVEDESSIQILPMDGNETALRHGGRPLDLFLLSIRSTDAVEIRAHALEDGARLGIHQVTADGVERKPFVIVDGEAEVEVFLTAVDDDEAPAPGGLRLDLEGSGDVTVVATPYYRVCGVPQG